MNSNLLIAFGFFVMITLYVLWHVRKMGRKVQNLEKGSNLATLTEDDVKEIAKEQLNEQMPKIMKGIQSLVQHSMKPKPQGPPGPPVQMQPGQMQPGQMPPGQMPPGQMPPTPHMMPPPAPRKIRPSPPPQPKPPPAPPSKPVPPHPQPPRTPPHPTPPQKPPPVAKKDNKRVLFKSTKKMEESKDLDLDDLSNKSNKSESLPDQSD